ncbi:class II myosin, partial [Linderina pennispora]
SACVQIFKDTNIAAEEWQIGTTKAFIRHPETLWALENLRERYWHNMASRIQRAWRAHMAFKHVAARKIQRFWLGKKEALELLKVREKGHDLLGGRKERRRLSLISVRVFAGDYLGVNGSSAGGIGQLIRDAAGIGKEKVKFSSDIQCLVPRSMRSAIPMPRSLVVSGQYLYVLSAIVSQGLLQYSVETKAGLVNIKDLAMSPYQDGWTVIHLEGQPDLVIECELKTELLTVLNAISNGRIKLQVNSTIEYKNKKLKPTQIKFVKNEQIKRPQFLKKTVQVPTGEPANKRSNPPPYVKPTAISAARTNVQRSKPKPAVSVPARTNGNVQRQTSPPRQSQRDSPQQIMQ